jgi:hypothetical protein
MTPATDRGCPTASMTPMGFFRREDVPRPRLGISTKVIKRAAPGPRH